MARLRLAALVGAFLVLFPGSAWTATERVALPITLDYPFLRAALIYQMYTRPGQRALLTDKDQGCTRVEIWDPQVGPEGDLLRIRTQVRIKAGVVVLGKCLDPVNWQGYVEVHQKVGVDPSNWRFWVKTQNSQLYDQKMKPTTVGNIIWGLIKEYVHAYLDRFSLNLAPPVKDLKGQLPLLFKPEKREKVNTWLAGLRTGEVKVLPQAVKVEALLDVDLPPPAEPEVVKPVPLSPEELSAFIRYWETWDSYLVHEIMALRGKPLSGVDRDLLLATLLDLRQGFVGSLAEPRPGHDLVRRQFLHAWRVLAPILRENLSREPSSSLFNYLAFFTASDALAVFDKLGPALGLEISQEGLVRLARLVSRGPDHPSLEYSTVVDADLRRLLGMGPPLDESGPSFEENELEETTSTTSRLRTRRWADFWFSPAWAAPTVPDKLTEILPWLPRGQEKEEYLKRVRELLDQTAEEILKRGDLEAKYHPLVRQVLPALVWQESCWRQFVVKAEKVTYLRSYNNTSVGMMQVNERVWRGIYKPTSLRWNIQYNTKAGCEILALYLKRYVLALLGGPADQPDDQLALAVYAAYNGGPSRMERFLKIQKQKKTLWLAERLFLEKYNWVRQGRLELIPQCLGGG